MSDQNLSSSVRTRIRRFSEIDNAYGEHYRFRSRVPFKSFDDRSLDPRNRGLEDVFRVIDDIGWSYTVLHVNPFCPRVVREFISNIPFYEDGALIRGFV
ncbi:hypothetical protein F2Q70_00028255 [Brassica cretica]|uniref:Uncharacterized protein n=1 Tax=Brassica cretica TaxID=69181 RepID=A0A8S9L9G2_BRACR|nr:hypothetical protein F2Q70_00028255 [Brassica cretica]